MLTELASISFKLLYMTALQTAANLPIISSSDKKSPDVHIYRPSKLSKFFVVSK